MPTKRQTLLLILAPLVAIALTACPVDRVEPPNGDTWDDAVWDEATWN